MSHGLYRHLVQEAARLLRSRTLSIRRVGRRVIRALAPNGRSVLVQASSGCRICQKG